MDIDWLIYWLMSKVREVSRRKRACQQVPDRLSTRQVMNGWWRRCRATSCVVPSTPTTRPVGNQTCTSHRPEAVSYCSCGCRTAHSRCRAPSRSTHLRSNTDGWSVRLLSWQRWWSLLACFLSASASPWRSTSTNSVRPVVTLYTTK